MDGIAKTDTTKAHKKANSKFVGRYKVEMFYNVAQNSMAEKAKT
jgi:hypothetical protein